MAVWRDTGRSVCTAVTSDRVGGRNRVTAQVSKSCLLIVPENNNYYVMGVSVMNGFNVINLKQ